MKKKSKAFPIILMVIGLCLIAFAVFKLLQTRADYQYSIKLYEQVNESYVEADSSVIAEPIIEGEDYSWATECVVDFDALQTINPDVCGWIYFENEDISYPIMYSGDDETYLHMTMDRQTASAGSIFVEAGNNPDFSDSHTIIYGHNMRNLSMFGKLKFYKNDPEYYSEHQYFQIITPEASYRYQIFSYHDTTVDSYVYMIPYDPYDPDFQTFINTLYADSYANTGVAATTDDRIITLSTCSYSDDVRMVVHGVRVSTYEWETEGE